jgi:hypothetical protein
MSKNCEGTAICSTDIEEFAAIKSYALWACGNFCSVPQSIFALEESDATAWPATRDRADHKSGFALRQTLTIRLSLVGSRAP